MTAGEALKPELLPVFLVIDTSYSMLSGVEPDRLIDRVNQIVPKIVEVCESKPTVNDKLRLSLISFSSDAQVVVKLGSKDDFIPELQAGGGTNYGAAFRLLRTEIEEGVVALNKSGARVFRPAVFFITDGEPIDPEDERNAAFAALTDKDFKPNPHIVVFGVADATPDTLKKYIHRKGIAIVAKSGVDAASALEEIIVTLVSSIVASTTGADDEGATGFRIVKDDIDDDLLDVAD